VLVHDPASARDEVVLLDLEREATLGIRRSLPATQLPRAAQDALMPPPRVSWFFEAADGGAEEASEGLEPPP
jgi:hypothetical protein